jgi:uncharacterized protein Yka (UPF0111/DUF47 family)
MSKLSLLPKEPKFFAFYQQQAQNIVKMAQQLKDMIYIWQNLKERADVLADMEQDGDAITHDVLRLLHRTYATPFDREDIPALANALDNIADRIHEIANALYLYGIKCPTERAKELCDIIHIATLEVEGGVSEMSSQIRKSKLLKRCATINQIEHSGDSIYRAALAELFAEPNDMATVVKWREVYQKMESTIDGCEDFADALEGIALKYG